MDSKRSFDLHDFSDEISPHDGSLGGIAEFLAKPDEKWGRGQAASDGQSFKASAIAWQEDIIATRIGGVWSLSREPEHDAFLAVRFAEGLGWSFENIVDQDIEFDPEAGEYKPKGDLKSALIRWLVDNDEYCEDIEYVAVGRHENNWCITFHSEPTPHCTAECVQ